MLRLILVLILGALSATAAAADNLRLPPGSPEAGARRLAELMDVNRDGVISREEFGRHSAGRARWQTLDDNDDGKLDATEQATGLRPGPRRVR